jgi:thymidylate synthase
MIYKSISEAWDSLVTSVAKHGEHVYPRGMATLELSNIAYEYVSGNYLEYVFNNPIRKANPVYHIVELFYYLNGRNDNLRGNYIKNAEEYANPITGTHDGSYGNAFYNGLPWIIAQLQKDPDTRRAVISTIRTPEHIMNLDSKDVPCNDIFRWAIRNDCLDMNVVTRSQDLYIGWIYNTLGFQLLHLMLAKALDLEVGIYGHYIFSLHLYEKDIIKALESVGKTKITKDKPQIVDYSPIEFFKTIRLMNSVLEFPALNGYEYKDFDNDLIIAIKTYKNLMNEKTRLNIERGLYTRWVDDWLESK